MSTSTSATGDSSSSDVTGDVSTSAAATTLDPVQDVGLVHDFGDGTPIGCKGKIDILFVISRDGTLKVIQEQLIAALPDFIETIASKFEDFDYHIMVVDADDIWGLSHCTGSCPDVSACKKGDPCCEANFPEGELCCGVPDYPCVQLDLVTECDWVLGAGMVFPAGASASNKRCKIDGGRRYLVKGQGNLIETFSCIAQVGFSGANRIGEALLRALSKGANGLLGCNAGFLRDDALLMVTLVTPGGDDSYWGDASIWYKAVVAAKNGDPKAIVMLVIGQDPGPCKSYDEPCKLAQMLPYNLGGDSDADDYGPIFEEATDLVEVACEQLIPQ